MLNLPTTVGDLDQLIKDHVQEDLHLDYKESLALDKGKKGEIGKDISAFANSDGGVLIYGIVEDNNLPLKRDGGAEHSTYSREWLDQVISSNVTPRVEGIVISPIQITDERSYYVVEIPKSFRGPHQAPDKKYYRRFNFMNVPMEDYEISDVRNRRQIVPRLVDVNISIRHKSWVHLNIENVGEHAAEDVHFDLSPELLPWVEKGGLRLFKEGIKYFPPNRRFSFNYGFINALVHEGGELPSRFQIEVSYQHSGVGQRIRDVFHFDLMDYWGSSLQESELYEHGREMKEAIKKLTDEVSKLNNHISQIVPIAGPTGLDLSVSSVRNLHRVVAGDKQLYKINPSYQSYRVFIEVLSVDFHMACRLEDFFRRGNRSQGLGDVENMTEDLARRIDECFELTESSLKD